MSADPKPSPRVVDRSARPLVDTGGRCALCGRVPSGHPLDGLNRMHLVPRGLGGDDVPANLIWGCGSGTSGCHGALTDRRGSAYRVAAARLVRFVERHPEHLEYAEAKRWPGWVEGYYHEGGS